jgi:hypothetical protein
LLAGTQREWLCNGERASYDSRFELCDCAVSCWVFLRTNGDGGVEIIYASWGDGAIFAHGEVGVGHDVSYVSAGGVDLLLCGGRTCTAEACVRSTGEVGGRCWRDVGED